MTEDSLVLSESQTPDGPAPLPAYPFRLVDCYLFDCQVTRTGVTDEGDGETPTFETRLETFPDDDGSFLALLSITVSHRFRAETSLDIALRTAGVFKRDGDLPSSEEKTFREFDCAFLIWPYARAYVGELARMTGIDVPALPTIDVREALRTSSHLE